MTVLVIITFILSLLLTPLYFAVRNRPNGVCGIRVSYTLDYPDIWKKVHTLTGVTSAIFNVIEAIALFTTSGFTFAFILFICLIFHFVPGCIYARLLGSKREREEYQQEEQERRQAEAEESDILIQK